MKNLIKNAIRSFKNNKISLIGLIFLLFFGLGTFCVMSNTTSNISNQYTSIAKKGNLHDFTASELYEIGNAAYKCHNQGFEYTTDGAIIPTITYNASADINKLSTDLYSITTTPTDKGTYNYVVPVQTRAEEGDNYIYTRTYKLELDPTASTGLYAKFAATGAAQTKFEVRVTESIAKTADTPAYITAVANLQGDASTWTDELMEPLTRSETLLRDAGNVLAHDFNYFLKGIGEQTSLIFNLVTTQDTLLSQHLDKNYKDELDYRFFKSINVTASKDNIFYKVIDSNPTDTIDQIVLFKDPNGNYGNDLFDSNDWAPFNSQLEFHDSEGKFIKPGTKFDDDFTIPSTFEDLMGIKIYARTTINTWDDNKKFVYSQILHIRFKRMWSGDRSSVNDTVEGLLQSLAAINYDNEQYVTELFFAGASSIADSYDKYVNYSQNLWNENIIISMNGNIVINWSVPTPLTCTLVNWTSHFSIINPQHLQANNKHVLDSKWFNNFEPYREWYKAQRGYYPSGNIDQRTIISWFNSLTNKQFNFWWNPNADTGISEMEYQIYRNDGTVQKIVVVKGKHSSEWNGLPSESIASCGEYNQIIWGCGLTPDFMYPVVDVTRPTPNPKTECLTYCNDAGYKALKLAFFNSPVEDFLIAKFMPSVTTTRQQQIIDELNKFCADNMLFPKEIKAVYRSNDTSNVLNSSAFRVSYIPNLVGVIDIISIILCAFLGVLSLVICLIIIKRYVENNRVNIGIMRANGISKIKIAISLFPFALLPALVGGIAAYLVGLFLQIPMLSLFKNYWTLPTPVLSFNWVSMVICIFLPFLLFFAMTVIATMWVLHTKSVDLMKAGSEFKTNSFSKVAKKPFRHFGVLTRFRVALAFNSLSRLIVLALMSCLTMTSLVFAMTTFGRLNQSQAINSSQFDYSFNLELTTPTTVGGVYAVEDWSAKREDGTLKGLGYTNEDQYLYNTSWNTQGEKIQSNLTKWYSHNLLSLATEYKNAIGNNGNLMLPTVADALGQKQDLQYLINKTCCKLTLDYVVGLGSLSSNPWEIAIALMPANSRNLASSGYNKIVEKMGTMIDNDSHPQHAKWEPFREFFAGGEEGGKLTKPYEMSVTTKSWLSHFSADYVKFLIQIYTDEELIADEYRISYGIIPTNWTYGVETLKKDELYSYITGKFTSISSKQRPTYDANHEITIEGIAKDSEYIRLTDSNGNDLNSLLYAIDKDEEYQPIIVNAYAAHKYNLGVGSSFSILASNTADRYDRQINPEYDKQDKSNQANFKVVGVSQGTNGEAFYCRQNDANNILGLPNGRTWNKTHKYMLWQENALAAKRVIDLSGINASEGHYAVYTVDSTTGTLIKEDTEVERFNDNIPTGFNGIYTADKSGRPLTSGISLYSYSGLYPGASVFNSDAMKSLLTNGNNLALANFLSGINDSKIYDSYRKYLSGEITDLSGAAEELIGLLRKYYGDTTMVTCICGANDVAASDLIYKNLISTFNLAETSIMSVVIPITIIVVGIISNLIINDSKKMAAMLKALGYSDSKNAASILALFIPTIVLGLALAIPASMGICAAYQSLIFTNANILIDVSRKWWYYLASIGGIGIVLVATYVVGWVSLKRDRLVDAIKR